MDQYQEMSHEQLLFGAFMMVSNQMKSALDQELKMHDVTASQLYMSMLIQHLNNGEPTIKEVAYQMRSSHQNIKQIALKLKDKGLIELTTDSNDKRVTRLSLTSKSGEFWKQMEPKAFKFINEMFKGVSDEQKTSMRIAVLMILQNLEAMNNKGKDL